LAPPLVGEQPAVDDGGRLALYGDQTVPQIAVIDLPAWAELYSVFGWPLLWGFTRRSCTSVLLPRLAKLTGRTWLSVLIVVAAWAPAAHRRAVHP